MDFKASIEGVTYEVKVDPVPDDSKLWLGLTEDMRKGNYEEFMVNACKKAFPSLEIDSLSKISNLASRNKAFRTFFNNKSNEYGADAQTPLYIKDVVDPVDYVNATKLYGVCNEINLARSRALNEKAKEYKQEIEQINAKADAEISNKIGDNKIFKIINMATDRFPLSLAAAIEKYTPKTSAAPTKDAYAREIYIRFKIGLLKLLKKNPKFDIDAYLDSVSLK